MIGKCPNCQKVISAYSFKYLKSDLSTLNNTVFVCKYCKTEVDWPIPNSKLKVAKLITPFAMLSASLMAIFPNSFSFYFFILGILGLGLFAFINPPKLLNK